MLPFSKSTNVTFSTNRRHRFTSVDSSCTITGNHTTKIDRWIVV